MSEAWGTQFIGKPMKGYFLERAEIVVQDARLRVIVDESAPEDAMLLLGGLSEEEQKLPLEIQRHLLAKRSMVVTGIKP